MQHRADELDLYFVGRRNDPRVARAACDVALLVAVFIGAAHLIRPIVAVLRDELIHDAIRFLPRVEVVLAVEHRGDVMADEQLLDRRAPPGPA